MSTEEIDFPLYITKFQVHLLGCMATTRYDDVFYDVIWCFMMFFVCFMMYIYDVVMCHMMYLWYFMMLWCVIWCVLYFYDLFYDFELRLSRRQWEFAVHDIDSAFKIAPKLAQFAHTEAAWLLFIRSSAYLEMIKTTEAATDIKNALQYDRHNFVWYDYKPHHKISYNITITS